MSIKDLIAYTFFALKAIKEHKKYNVSIEYMELLYRIKYRSQADSWSMPRLFYELSALRAHLPDEDLRYQARIAEEKI
jgi:hypothetical protein